MAKPEHKPDVIRALEALIATPRAGQAVMRALTDTAAARNDRMLIAEMRMQRAARAGDAEIDRAEARRMAAAGEGGGSPWMRRN